MSILTKTVDDLAAERVTLSEVRADLFDLAAQASALCSLMQSRDDDAAEEPEALYAQRLARLLLQGVEQAACAMGHVHPQADEAPLSDLRAGGGLAVEPLARLIPAQPCAGMMLTAEDAAGLVELRRQLQTAKGVRG